MIISPSSPIIKYSAKGVEFKYTKLFLQTIEPYIIQFKGVEYEKLVDKDKSIALAKIIRQMKVNGVSVSDFYKNKLDKWNDKDNFERIMLLIDVMARDIFSCYDKNMDDDNNKPLRSRNIYYISTDKGDDFFEPEESPKSLFGRPKDAVQHANHEYFLSLKSDLRRGVLPTTAPFTYD